MLLHPRSDSTLVSGCISALSLHSAGGLLPFMFGAPSAPAPFLSRGAILGKIKKKPPY